MKKIAIVQSNYIPWKGYFDMIASVDEFILFDDMQYTRRDWRNRNKIKTRDGLKWLTVPVKVKGKYLQTIRETEIDGEDWLKKHWMAICQNYQKAEYFDEVVSILEPLYMSCKYDRLSALNRTFLEAVCNYLGIETKISNSWDYGLADGKTERLIDLALQAGGTEYVSGPAARGYLEEHLFADVGLTLTWFNYDDYPEYPQLWDGFEHGVTILDLLFNCGKQSPLYMKYVKS